MLRRHLRAPALLVPLALLGCPTPPASTAASPTPAGGEAAIDVSAPPQGSTRTVTLRGTVTVSGGGTAAGGNVHVVSVTPNNPFDRRVTLAGDAYEVEDVPASCQYALVATVPGQAAKLRLDTVLSTASPVLVRNFGGDAREDLVGSNYTVGMEWCATDAMEAAAEGWLAQRSLLADIPIYQASPIAPAAPTPTPAPAGALPVYQASPIAVFTAKPITPCVAHMVKPITPAGVEETAQQGPPERELVGNWGVEIPGAAWSSELISGNTVVTTTHVGFGAGLGELAIQADGRYTWSGAAGKLRQVIPFNDAVPGAAYWLLADGGGKQHYLALTGKDAITLYLPGTNLFVADGQRLR